MSVQQLNAIIPSSLAYSATLYEIIVLKINQTYYILQINTILTIYCHKSLSITTIEIVMTQIN